jgi:flavin-dependent dehydrogenase
VIAEGISMAIQSSALLAELLIAHRGERYAQAWKRRFAARIQTSAVFAQLAMRAPTRAACLALLRAAPGLMGVGARLSGKIPISA